MVQEAGLQTTVTASSPREKVELKEGRRERELADVIISYPDLGAA
jgi:hypothetical protein